MLKSDVVQVITSVFVHYKEELYHMPLLKLESNQHLVSHNTEVWTV